MVYLSFLSFAKRLVLGHLGTVLKRAQLQKGERIVSSQSPIIVLAYSQLTTKQLNYKLNYNIMKTFIRPSKIQISRNKKTPIFLR